MTTRNVPKCLWDYGLIHEAEVLSILVHGKDGIPGLEKITGQTIDISEYLDFAFWDLIWYWDYSKLVDMGDEQKKFGRWLGIAHCVGSNMCYWILTEYGKVIAWMTVQHVLFSELQQASVKS